MTRANCAAVPILGVLALGACGWNSDDHEVGAAGDGASGAPLVTHPPRPERYAACPRSGVRVPETMVLVDRLLPNLGDGHLGRIETYDAGTAQLEVATGVDVLDEYEDLDFESRDVTVAGREVTISIAGAFGTGDRLIVLTWEEPAQEAPCNLHTLVGTNLPEAVLIDLATGSVSTSP